MANYIERDIFVLRDTSCVAHPIEYVQGTNAIPILLHVRDYDIPTGSTARVYVQWPSGKGEYDAGGITISGNDILINPKDTLFSEVGKSILQVRLVNGGNTLVTFSHPVMVKKNHTPGITDPSENHSDFLDEYIQNMTNATDTANKAAENANEAADAANTALGAMQGAVDGTLINDESPSSVTTYSSEKIEEGLSLMDIQISTDCTYPQSNAGGLRMLEMSGNTKQETYSGKNLLNCSGLAETTMNGITFTPIYKANGMLAYINVNGVATANAYYYIARKRMNFNGTYVINGCPSGGDPNKYASLILYNDIFIEQLGNDVKLTLSPTDDTKDNYYAIKIVSGTTVSNLKFYPMISVDGGNYEPYCGEQSSPNSEYIQAVESVGDCIDLLAGFYNTNHNGEYSRSEGTSVCSKYHIPCKPGDIIKINTEIARKIRHMFYTGSSLVSFDKSNEFVMSKEFVVPDGVDNFAFYLNSNTRIVPETAGKVELTVNGKYVIPVKTHGKNLVRSCIMTNTSTNYGNLLANVAADIKKDVTYTISVELTALYNTTAYWNPSSNQFSYKNISVKAGTNTYSFTFKALEDGVPSEVWLSKSSSGDNVTIEITNVQIEEGKTATDYEPYRESAAYLYIDEPLRKVGDVADRIVKETRAWNVNRKVRETVFDGSDDEEWYIDGTGRFVTKSLNELAKGSSAPSSKGNIICNQFINRSANATYSNIIGISIDDGSNIQIYTDKFTTIEEWKAHLASTPMILDYELAVPIYETLDTASQIALNSLKTFDTVTYSEVDSKIPPSGIKVKYGTSEVGALSLENANLHDIVDIACIKGSIANNLTTTEEGFVLDARQGAEIATELADTVKKDDIIIMTKSVSTGYLEANLGVGMKVSSGLSSEQYLIISANAYTTGSSTLRVKVDVAELEIIDSDGIQAVKVYAKNITDTTINETVTINVRMVLVKIA